MSLVLDTSIAITWCFQDESNSAADFALDRTRDHGAVVPAIWWYEFRNVLLVGERRGRIDAGDMAVFIRDLSSLPIRVDWPPDEAALLTLARQHDLTVYDAAYLELATRLAHPLATLDRRLAAAARRAGVALLEPGAP